MNIFHKNDESAGQVNQFDREFYQAMIDTSLDGAFVVENKVFKLVNHAFCKLTGCSQAELLGEPFERFIYTKNDSVDYQEILQEPSIALLDRSVIQKDTTPKSEYHLVVANTCGEDSAIEMRSQHFVDNDGRQYQVASLRKKLPEQAAMRSLRESENNLQRLIDQLPYMYFQTNASGVIVKASFHTANILEYNSEEFVGMSLSEIYFDENDQAETLARVIGNKGQPVDITTYLVSKNGSRIKVSLRVFAKYDIQRNFVGLDVMQKNVSEKDVLSKKTVVRDPLTKLVSQPVFNEHLSKSIRYARRHQKKLWVIYLSLQNLSDIKDLFGKTVRDTCLVNFAQRLQSYFRDTDIVARVAGGDFIVLLDNYTRGFLLDDLTNGLHDVMKKKANISQYPYGFSFNLGQANFPLDGLTSEELVNHSESMMYKHKFSNNLQQSN